MLGRKRDAPHGAHVGERAAVLLEHGVPALRVAYRAAEHLGRFAAAENLARLPALPLPEDPPDWETRTYHLTLRGRDALDPMTELSMRFAQDYGPSGKQILQALRRGLDVETTAAELGLELDQLAAWLRRLEEDGMVRVDGSRAGGAGTRA
jgi:predicted Rossmann fold nucleotide-binding protein DprA/Smf involved in DNA uptake